MDITTIILYLAGIGLNIGVVAAIQKKAYTAGKQFLSSGRFAIITVFLLCFLEQLVIGQMEGLKDSASLMKLVQDAWLMAGTVLGTHATGKTLFGSTN